MKECKVLNFSFYSGQQAQVSEVPFIQETLNEYIRIGWQINNVLKDGSCLLVVLIK